MTRPNALVISLSPEAHPRAIELTRTFPCDIESWTILDHTLTVLPAVPS